MIKSANTGVFSPHIPNCDTVKRARAWLDDHDIAYGFHDFKKQGVPEAELDRWLAALGWETLVNRRGTTWRKLDDATRESVVDAASARAVLLANPSLIKRPVVDWHQKARQADITAGFDAEQWARTL
ncbi:arsenate reductase [Variovorax sp. DAIF25]|uniref:arsenate reductase n=1 Tax=Variovorax sp. DAIF25 TaxID=3080983 RepID=UPI003D6B482B